MIKTNLLGLLSVAVIPLLKPTVPKAETHSKLMFNNPFSISNKLMENIEIESTKTDRVIMANALLTEF